MKKMKPLQWVFVSFLALSTIWSIIAELTSHHHETVHHWWSGVPFFWIWFGLIGCILLIVIAKNILAPFIYKKEDYYNE